MPAAEVAGSDTDYAVVVPAVVEEVDRSAVYT
jgi:hypothetical protein